MRSAALAIPILGLCACATVAGGGATQPVTLRSVQPACFVVRTLVGVPVAQDTTPSTVSLRRKERYEVDFRARGYAPQTLSFRRGINGWTKANTIFMLGGPLVIIPIAIDLNTGARYKIEPDTVTVSLDASASDTAAIHCPPLRP